VLAEFSRLSYGAPQREKSPESPLSHVRLNLQLVATGANNQEIAGKLFIARGTVKIIFPTFLLNWR